MAVGNSLGTKVLSFLQIKEISSCSLLQYYYSWVRYQEFRILMRQSIHLKKPTHEKINEATEKLFQIML